MGNASQNSLPSSGGGVNSPAGVLAQTAKTPLPALGAGGWADVGAVGLEAWLIPGLGHALCGFRRHGAVVGAAIGFLWITGLAIGGLSVLDVRPAPVGQRAWFLAEAGLAPSCLLERVHARMRAGDHPPQMALGRGRDVGTLLLATAGLLNLMAVADAMRRAAGQAQRAAAEKEPVTREAA